MDRDGGSLHLWDSHRLKATLIEGSPQGGFTLLVTRRERVGEVAFPGENTSDGRLLGPCMLVRGIVMPPSVVLSAHSADELLWRDSSRLAKSMGGWVPLHAGSRVR